MFNWGGGDLILPYATVTPNHTVQCLSALIGQRHVPAVAVIPHNARLSLLECKYAILLLLGDVQHTPDGVQSWLRYIMWLCVRVCLCVRTQVRGVFVFIGAI